MPSTKSFCNKTLFVKNLSRFWPIPVIYFLILLILLPVRGYTICKPFTLPFYRPNGIIMILNYSRDAALKMGPGLSFFFACGTACVLYSYLYQSRSVQFMGSLPVSREAMFGSAYLAGFCMLSAPVILTMCIMFIQQIGFGVPASRALLYDLETLGIYLIQMLLFYSLAVFSAQLTGHFAIMPPMYLFLNFFLIIGYYLFVAYASIFLPHCVFSRPEFVTYSSPLVWMSFWHSLPLPNDQLAVSSFHWIYYVYLTAGLLLTFAAMLLHRRRKMENASEIISYRPLRSILKYVLSLMFGLGMGYILYVLTDSNASFEGTLLFVFISTLIGYFGIEMVLQKSFRVLRSWKGFVVCILLSSAFLLAMMTDVLGWEKAIPDPNGIESAKISPSGTVSDSEMKDRIRELHQFVLENEDALRKHHQDNEISLWFEYDMKAGHKMIRKFENLPFDLDHLKVPGTYEYMFTEIYHSEESIRNLYGIDKTIQHGFLDFTSVPTDSKEPAAQPEGDNSVPYQNITIELDAKTIQYILENCLIPDYRAGKLLQYPEYVSDWIAYRNEKAESETYYRSCYLHWEYLDSDPSSPGIEIKGTGIMLHTSEDFDTLTGQYIMELISGNVK
ncbi:MAG: hypothetical protein IJM90_06360 [Firmicutes bacterium]|nr:hypothetical protein [Bacillota bacterium]